MKNHGIIIRGTLLGYKSNQYVNKETGEVKQRHILGIGISRLNEFGSKSEQVQKISIPNSAFTNEFINKIESLKTKDVEISVEFNVWEFNGNSGMTATYVPELGITELK